MEIELKLFPRGQFEGMPMLAVSLDGGTLPSVDDLRNALIAKATVGPGVRGIWLERVPWDMPEADTLFMRATAHDDLGSLSLFAVPRVTDLNWPSIQVFWSADATGLLMSPDSMSIEQRCQGLPFLPHVEEIWLENVPEEQISGGVLDALSRGMRARCGYIYATPKTYALAVLAVCRSSYIWSARRR